MASLKEITPFQEENKGINNILYLPMELLIIIFKFMKLKDGIELSKTNKWFNKAVKESFCSPIYEININNYNYNKLNNILKDIKVYKKQNFKITLNNIPEITDVSALGSVHSLQLRFCSGITDVSALGSVHSLNISGCPNIVKGII